jgi:hypothetical protein
MCASRAKWFLALCASGSPEAREWERYRAVGTAVTYTGGRTGAAGGVVVIHIISLCPLTNTMHFTTVEAMLKQNKTKLQSGHGGTHL